MSTGTPEMDWSLSTGMRAETTRWCFRTQGTGRLVRSSLSALRAWPMAPGGHEMSRSTTSISEDERASPVEREP